MEIGQVPPQKKNCYARLSYDMEFYQAQLSHSMTNVFEKINHFSIDCDAIKFRSIMFIQALLEKKYILIFYLALIDGYFHDNSHCLHYDI